MGVAWPGVPVGAARLAGRPREERDGSCGRSTTRAGVRRAALTASYIPAQMHPYDRFFYDPETGSYTVDRFLDDLEARCGGVDAILMWPTYTNIGADDRNQFDLFARCRRPRRGAGRDQPVARQGRAVLAVQPVDTGTRREPMDDEHTFAKLLNRPAGTGSTATPWDSFPNRSGPWPRPTVRVPNRAEPEDGGTGTSSTGTRWDGATGPVPESLSLTVSSF